jgi:hypothetical protein
VLEAVAEMYEEEFIVTYVDDDPVHPDQSVTVRSYSPEAELYAGDIDAYCELDE